jgi:hypothetical protein
VDGEGQGREGPEAKGAAHGSSLRAGRV